MSPGGSVLVSPDNEFPGQGPGVGPRPSAHCRIDRLEPFESRSGRHAHRCPFSVRFRRAETGPAAAIAAIQVLSQDCSYYNRGCDIYGRTPREKPEKSDSTSRKCRMRNGEKEMADVKCRTADDKCRYEKGRPRFLGATKWAALPRQLSRQRLHHGLALISGSCPEPENCSVSVRFSL